MIVLYPKLYYNPVALRKAKMHIILVCLSAVGLKNSITVTLSCITPKETLYAPVPLPLSPNTHYISVPQIFALIPPGGSTSGRSRYRRGRDNS